MDKMENLCNSLFGLPVMYSAREGDWVRLKRASADLEIKDMFSFFSCGKSIVDIPRIHPRNPFPSKDELRFFPSSSVYCFLPSCLHSRRG